MDPVEVELPDTKKTTTSRAKSTKAAPKVTKGVSNASAKAPAPKKLASKPIASSAAPKAAPKAPEPSKTVKQAAPAQPEGKRPALTAEKPSVSVKLDPASSKILQQLKEVEAKKASSQQPSPAEAVSTSTAPTAKSSSIPQTKTPASKPSPIKPAASPPPPPPKLATKPHVPIAALNSQIVSNITTRAGARPNTAGSRPLPPNYKSVARKVTSAIVALPIAIGTSYWLYQRLVLGEEQKVLVPVLPSEPPKVDTTNPETVKVEAGNIDTPRTPTTSS